MKPKIKKCVLFEGSELGDINLVDNINNYKYVEIMFSSSVGEYDSVKVPACAEYINCNTVLLDAGIDSNIGFIFIAKQLKNEGPKLSVKASSRLYKYQKDAGMTQDTLNQLYIRKVIGYIYERQ